MKLHHIFLVLLFFWSAPAASTAQTVSEKFGTMPETWSAKLSPDGKHLALGCSPTGVRGVCIYELDGQSKPRLALPPEGGRIQGVRWASEDYLIYTLETFERIATTDGLQAYNIRRMISYSLKTGKTSILLKNVGGFVDLTYIESRLIDDPEKIQSSISFGTGKSTTTGSRLNKASSTASYITYEVNLKTGRAKPSKTFSGNKAGAIFDARGSRLALIEWNPKTKNYALLSDLADGKAVYTDTDAVLMPFYIAGLGPNQKSLVVSFDNADRFGLYHLSLIDGAITEVTYDGEHVGDVSTFQDPFTNEVIGYRYTDHIREDFYLVEPFAKVAADAQKALKADSIVLTSWSRDRRQFTLRAINQGRPEQYYLYDIATPSISPLGGEAPWLDSQPLGAVKPFTYTARDGMELEGYYTLPPGHTSGDGTLPLVMLPHGGPEARDTAGYDWLAQALAAEGYLVVQPNFRGSTGYGQAYRDAGHGEFGGKMILDIVDAANWALRQNLANSPEYCVLGASYGGYAALMSFLKDRDRVKCLVSINGVTDPISFIGEYNRKGIGFEYWQQYMGDYFSMSDANRQSMTPFSRADEFAAPILLIHGREDTTVPVEQSRSMARALGNRRNVTYTEIDGDDHYLSSTESRVTVLDAALNFLGTHHPAR